MTRINENKFERSEIFKHLLTLTTQMGGNLRVRWYGPVHRLPPHHPSGAILDYDPRPFGCSDPEEPHAHVALMWSNVSLIHPQLNNSRRTTHIRLINRTECFRANP